VSPSGPSWDVDGSGHAVDLDPASTAATGGEISAGPVHPGSAHPGPVHPGSAHPGSASPEAQEQRNHLRLIRQQESRRANRRRLLVSLGIACVAVLCLGLVALHVLIAENQFRLDQLQQTAASQQEKYERLRLQVAQLEAPARIVSEAQGRLGMVQPGSVTYLPAVSSTSKSTRDVANGTSGDAGANDPPGAASQGGLPAPEGDADWPSVKPYLSGNP
jgi:cell division protein FtsL